MQKRIMGTGFLSIVLLTLAYAGLHSGVVHSQPVQGASYVRAGASGDGSDWANALPALPATLERDHVYYVADGVYAAYTVDDPAAGSDTITILKATAGDHGTDTGWHSAYGDGVATFQDWVIRDTAYIVLDGQAGRGFRLERNGLGGRALLVQDADHVTLRNCDIDGNFAALSGDEPAGHTYGACNVMDAVRTSYLVIEDCLIHDAADDGLGFYDSDHFIIQGNEIYNLYGVDDHCQGHSDGIEAYNLEAGTFDGNLVYDVRSTAAFYFGGWADEIGDGPSDYCASITVTNNIFYSPETGFAMYIQDVDGLDLHHNVIWGTRKGRYGGLAIGEHVTDMDMYNNIILSINYQHMGVSYDPVHHRGDYNLFGAALNQYPENVNGHDIVDPDPQFINIPDIYGAAQREVTSGDFRIAATSPCVNAGTDVGVTADLWGTPRPRGGGWDIGAHEYQPDLLLYGSPGDASVYLNWTVGAGLPATATWRIDYVSDTLPSLVLTAIDSLSATRAYTLTGLTNYEMYTVTLHAMAGVPPVDATPFLSDTVRVMPTDMFVYLPLVSREEWGDKERGRQGAGGKRQEARGKLQVASGKETSRQGRDAICNTQYVTRDTQKGHDG